MDLKQHVRKELHAAMKAGDTVKRETLRTLLSAIMNAEVEKKEALNAEDYVAVVQREAKKRRESIEAFEAGGRLERAAVETQELHLLQSYLPQQLTQEALQEVVRNVIEQLSAQGTPNLGSVMGRVMGQVKGQADGNVVRQVVTELLQDA